MTSSRSDACALCGDTILKGKTGDGRSRDTCSCDAFITIDEPPYIGYVEGIA